MLSGAYREETFADARGAATPAVAEPRPSFWSERASNLPVGWRPFPAWNSFMAAIEEASHFPVGAPRKEPARARAS